MEEVLLCGHGAWNLGLEVSPQDIGQDAGRLTDEVGSLFGAPASDEVLFQVVLDGQVEGAVPGVSTAVAAVSEGFSAH
ncbi:MAG: hypothetical protein HY748_10860 [Elusimicrobia bacterium]|nr:hypothetical protein [Elusimicrobiota bacterium]